MKEENNLLWSPCSRTKIINLRKLFKIDEFVGNKSSSDDHQNLEISKPKCLINSVRGPIIFSSIS